MLEKNTTDANIVLMFNTLSQQIADLKRDPEKRKNKKYQGVANIKDYLEKYKSILVKVSSVYNEQLSKVLSDRALTFNAKVLLNCKPKPNVKNGLTATKTIKLNKTILDKIGINPKLAQLSHSKFLDLNFEYEIISYRPGKVRRDSDGTMVLTHPAIVIEITASYTDLQHQKKIIRRARFNEIGALKNTRGQNTFTLQRMLKAQSPDFYIDDYIKIAESEEIAVGACSQLHEELKCLSQAKKKACTDKLGMELSEATELKAKIISVISNVSDVIKKDILNLLDAENNLQKLLLESPRKIDELIEITDNCLSGLGVKYGSRLGV